VPSGIYGRYISFFNKGPHYCKHITSFQSLSAAQARLTAMNAEHIQLEAEVQELRARQAVMDEVRTKTAFSVTDLG
jgi:hypothetical protein